MKCVVAGVLGKMGQEILKAVLEEPRIQVVGAFERPDHDGVGRQVAPGLTVAGSLAECIDPCDVVIDFTHHTASTGHVRLAAEKNKCAVVGTTGFTPEETSEILKLGETIPIVLAPNMSVGINLMFKLVREMAQVLGSAYDIEIIEAHHRMKKDAPSGTAVRLGEILAQARDATLEQVGVFARHGMIGARTDSEIGLQTIRAGDIVGEHTVLFAGPGERVELIHRVHSRANFARGAVRAALWAAQQPPGLYDMQDVLGLR